MEYPFILNIRLLLLPLWECAPPNRLSLSLCVCAANLAVGMAQWGNRKVGLLDADLFGPSVPRLMNLQGKKAELSKSKRM